jgi:hypothetical protein
LKTRYLVRHDTPSSETLVCFRKSHLAHYRSGDAGVIVVRRPGVTDKQAEQAVLQAYARPPRRELCGEPMPPAPLLECFEDGTTRMTRYEGGQTGHA